jgi:hypothetical protein
MILIWWWWWWWCVPAESRNTNPLPWILTLTWGVPLLSQYISVCAYKSRFRVLTGVHSPDLQATRLYSRGAWCAVNRAVIFSRCTLVLYLNCFMEQSPSWETIGCSAVQYTSRRLRDPKTRYTVHSFVSVSEWDVRMAALVVWCANFSQDETSVVALCLQKFVHFFNVNVSSVE